MKSSGTNDRTTRTSMKNRGKIRWRSYSAWAPVLMSPISYQGKLLYQNMHIYV